MLPYHDQTFYDFVLKHLEDGCCTDGREDRIKGNGIKDPRKIIEVNYEVIKIEDPDEKGE